MKGADVMALIEEKHVQAVDVRFVDLPGLWQPSRCLPKSSARTLSKGAWGSTDRAFEAFRRPRRS